MQKETVEELVAVGAMLDKMIVIFEFIGIAGGPLIAIRAEIGKCLLRETKEEIEEEA